VPFVQGGFRKKVHDPVALLGFLGSAFVSKVRGWPDIGGAPDYYVAIITIDRDDFPLKRLVSNTGHLLITLGRTLS